jgi:hypothetical protein
MNEKAKFKIGLKQYLNNTRSTLLMNSYYLEWNLSLKGVGT